MFRGFSEVFKFPYYIIKPEERTIKRSRPDLTVSKLNFELGNGTNLPSHIIYEGKREKNINISTTRWMKVRRELLDYARQSATTQGQRIYCVGAIGRRVAFWRFTRGDTELESVVLPGNGIHWARWTHLLTSYDIIDERKEIIAILKYIRDA